MVREVRLEAITEVRRSRGREVVTQEEDGEHEAGTLNTTRTVWTHRELEYKCEYTHEERG